MRGAIFLSAGVPDPVRGPDYAATADVVAIASAVAALLQVALGRRLIVFGGQPAITPMVWTVAQDMQIDYSSWVRLYQSTIYEDDFPEETSQFRNVTFVDPINNDPAASLAEMRRRMFSEHEYSAAVFLGGMGGILDEYSMLQSMQPNATIIPIASTGGAAEVLHREVAADMELAQNLDYVELFHSYLAVSPTEPRRAHPEVPSP